jgi:glycosyltransferase involved in cell wall biosynthesis
LTTRAFPDNNIPRVTVIMGVNRVDSYLGPAINSILIQTFQNFEFLIMVDAGCRDLKEKILELCVGDIRVRILESPSVGGFAFALNMGIAESHGEYIARMDSDDISLPERFEEQVRYLDENKDVDVLGCRVRLIDSVSESLERSYPYFQSNRDIRRVLPFRNPLMHPALMFRKSVLLSVQGYKYGHTSEDHEMYIRMARNPKIGFYNLDKLLFEHRRHEMQGTGLGRIKASYVEISGFLFTEFLLTHSPKYLFGMFVIHPWVRRARMALRKWRYGRTH